MNLRWPIEHRRIGILWIVLAVVGFSALSLTLTHPSYHSGIHESDSALYIVEAISLSQTSPLDAQPEWNTLVRIAALPWGGLHVVLLRLGLGLCAPSPDPCEFRAGCLFGFWSAVAVVSVLLAAVLGHLLHGPWGAFWASGLVAASVPHVKMYTQFNQLGTAALFSLLLLTAGAWRALRPDHLGAAIGLGVIGFLHPFADNMGAVMWLAFPVYLWLALTHRDRHVFAKAVAPYAIGTALAVTVMLCLIGLRWVTNATVYSCTLLHLASRAASLLTRPAHVSDAGTAALTLSRAVSLLGTGGTLTVALAALYAAARMRTPRDVCLVPVALAYAVPLLFVPPDATLVAEYLLHGLSLVLLTTGVIIAHLWASEGGKARWALPSRAATVACFLLMLPSARAAAESARKVVAGETWTSLGARLARLPAHAVIASTAEEEIGILYSGRRILTRNDTGATDLAPLFEAWPGPLDYLVIRPSEQDLFAAVIEKRHLQLIETASDGARDEWRIFGLPGGVTDPDRSGARRAELTCRRQPYIPYSFDAGWRYLPGSVLRQWGTAGLLQGDPHLWVEWSQATHLPSERFKVADAPGPPSSPTAATGSR